MNAGGLHKFRRSQGGGACVERNDALLVGWVKFCMTENVLGGSRSACAANDEQVIVAECLE